VPVCTTPRCGVEAHRSARRADRRTLYARLQVGNLVYVSGQGAGDSKGEFAPTVAGQLRQSLNNVKSVVEAAGLTMEHVVYAQLYATDAAAYDVLPSVWGEFFKEGGPALSRLGVTALPVQTPLEINAVAVTDLTTKRVIRLSATGDTKEPPDAVIAGDRSSSRAALAWIRRGRSLPIRRCRRNWRSPTWKLSSRRRG